MHDLFVPVVAMVIVETDGDWVNVPRQNMRVPLIVQVAHGILVESDQVGRGKKS